MSNPNVIFILGCHKSGTSLLRSLLDGHSDLIVFPKETHFFQYAGYGIKYPLRESWPNEMSNKEFIEGMVNGVKEENYGNDPYSDNPGFRSYNIELFREELTQLQIETPSQRIDSYFKALYKSLTGINFPDDKRIVEKSVESAEHVPWLRSMYPKSKFIHIVRNPYVTLASLRRSKSKFSRYPIMSPLIKSIYNSTFHLFQNKQLIKEYMVVRYEDLISYPTKIMKKIAVFLNINYETILLQPTINGEAWNGNSSMNVKFTGISNVLSEKWLSDINSIEIRLINKYLKPLLKEYGYNQLQPKHRGFWPAKKENITTYLYNRALMYL